MKTILFESTNVVQIPSLASLGNDLSAFSKIVVTSIRTLAMPYNGKRWHCPDQPIILFEKSTLRVADVSEKSRKAGIVGRVNRISRLSDEDIWLNFLEAGNQIRRNHLVSDLNTNTVN